MEEFLKAYLECAAFADAPEGYGHLDFTKASKAKAKKDCEAFFNANEKMIEADFSQAGHDFWLTRNGHGAGFWDREEIWGEYNATFLTGAAHAFGECSVLLTGRGGSQRLMMF